MNIQFFCPRWGSERLPWDVFLTKVKEAGYDGVEWAIPNNTCEEELQQVFNLAANMNMPVIAQHYETNFSDFSLHDAAYAAWLDKIKPFPVVKINSQTGKDYFSFEENKQLIERADEHARNTGQQVLHETHRGKFSFAAHIMHTYLKKMPHLRITLDASHWVNVAESYLEDQQEAMLLAIERTDHIHARVGYPEGPQVSDPRITEWEQALTVHLKWWDKVVAHKQALNKLLTVSPEFGPYPYMVNDPATGLPITGQWEINKYMMELLRDRTARPGM